MLNILTERWGRCTLEYLAGASVDVERGLNDLARERKWANNTWNRYYELLNALFNRAMDWKTNCIPRMANNPLASIERRVGTNRVHVSVRLEEDVEARLLAARDKLNRRQHVRYSKRLTWEGRRDPRGRCRRRISKDRRGAVGNLDRLCCPIVKRDVSALESRHEGRRNAATRQFRREERDAIAIELPPANTKGGKTVASRRPST